MVHFSILIIFFCCADATSGGTSGSGQAAEAKRDKIVILKGRGRVDSNVSRYFTVTLLWTYMFD